MTHVRLERFLKVGRLGCLEVTWDFVASSRGLCGDLLTRLTHSLTYSFTNLLTFTYSLTYFLSFFLSLLTYLLAAA